jgi:penicillin V acylase-like amidase (Ntn superfamily)
MLSKKIISAMALLSLLNYSLACTAVDIKAKDGSVVAGRTMEWAFDMQWQLVSLPKGSNLTLIAPPNSGLPPITTQLKYAVVGLSPGPKIVPQSVILEGQNSEGLGISGNFLPDFTQYQTVSKTDKNYMSILEFGTWLLGNFATVDQVKMELPKYKIWGDNNIAVGPTPPTVHYIITDKSGASVVVEFVKGEMKISTVSVNVLTNAPTYDWHLTNLRNYISLSNKGTASVTTPKGKISQLAQGIGMFGLPGDFTSSSRFVRTVFLRYYSDQPNNDAQAVQFVGHMLNNVDIPYGATKSSEGGKTITEYTQWVAIKDLTHNRLYFADYNHRLNFVSIDVNKFFALTTSKNIPISQIQYPTGDVTASLLN